MIIDAYTHAIPQTFKDAVKKRAKVASHLFTLWDTLPTLTDMDLRLGIMDQYAIDVHGLSTAAPALETLFDRETANELARVANDSMAEIVQNHPRRFFGIATVSMLDPEAAAQEVKRCVEELGFCGVQIYSNTAGRPIDEAQNEIFYDTVEKLNVPIWLHPTRTVNQPDYATEDKSEYMLWQVLGWPYETSLAMSRLVFSGIMHRHPELKVICHHAGAMIPFFAERIRLLYPKTEQMTGTAFAPDVPKPYVEQYKRFYVDTAIQGNVSALMNAYDFFGPERLIFASDLPFDIELGAEFTRVTLEAMKRMPVSEGVKEEIYHKNLARICPLPTSIG